MKLHANARTCLHGRRLIVERVTRRGWTRRQAAEAAGVSVRTVSKWLARYRAQGPEGLYDRSSAPRRSPRRTPADRLACVVALRRLRMSAGEIAAVLSMAPSTVSALLRRAGLGRLSRIEPPEPPNRYERRRAGELVHVDVKKLGRIARVGHRATGDRRSRARGIGWEYVHVAVDDATRLAYVEVLPDERAGSAVGFLERALAHFRAHGVVVERVMTDNGSPYVSLAHAAACRAHAIRHIRTRPYRPRTNGKAERFIRTLLEGWAYGAVYATSSERRSALAGWLDFYNRRRPHGSLGHQPPLARLEALMRNNVAGFYT
jgi:transposase InsO family protein